MNDIRFEWDLRKAAINLRKHRVSFAEAASVWNDQHRIIEPDVVHSTATEDRLQVLGLSDRLRLLLVIFTEIDEATIRLISARRANQGETRRYTEQF